MSEPCVWFVTPVWKRPELTAICLEQRRRMIDLLPFPAQAVVIGSDVETLDLAGAFGFDVVVAPNVLGAKFNAGYQRALTAGATHVMAVGSDSFLHPSKLAGAAELMTDRPELALGIVGFSSVSHDGRHRVDLEIKYAAGFGVGMVYPAWSLRWEPCDPRLMRGCDTSTWRRCGHGLGIEYLPAVQHGLVNFTSPTDQITPFRRLVGSQAAWRERVRHDGIEPLYELYDADLLDRVAALYEQHRAAAV